MHLPGTSTLPVLVQGGALLGLKRRDFGDILIEPFFIDACPVTNQLFETFIAENKQWTPAAIYDRYGIPYYLCEFRNCSPRR